jgi:hypothetical protein
VRLVASEQRSTERKQQSVQAHVLGMPPISPDQDERALSEPERCTIVHCKTSIEENALATPFRHLLIPAKAADSSGEAPSSYAKRMDKENIEFLRELSRMVGEKGFRDVQPVPQMFVFLAKGPDGREITLLVNSDSCSRWS